MNQPMSQSGFGNTVLRQSYVFNTSHPLPIQLPVTSTALSLTPPWSATHSHTEMNFASTYIIMQISHPKPAQLPQDKPGRQHSVHRSIPDYWNRATFTGGRGVAGEAKIVRAAAVQCPELLGADQIADREVLLSGEGNRRIQVGIREVE